MSNSSFRSLTKYNRDNLDDFARTVNSVVNGIMLGRTNNTGTVTLTANAGSTVVTVGAGQLGPYTQVIFTPKSASAATEYGAGTLYVSAINADNHQFTITHTNTADADKVFQYVLIG